MFCSVLKAYTTLCLLGGGGEGRWTGDREVERKYQIGGISNLCFLSFSGHDKQLSGGMLNFQLSDNGGSIAGDKKLVQMVDYHLVHSCNQKLSHGDVSIACDMEGPQKLCTVVRHRPFGPRDVLVMLDRPLHASMFLTTASSTPEKCLCPSLSMA